MHWQIGNANGLLAGLDHRVGHPVFFSLACRSSRRTLLRFETACSEPSAF